MTKDSPDISALVGYQRSASAVTIAMDRVEDEGLLPNINVTYVHFCVTNCCLCLKKYASLSISWVEWGEGERERKNWDKQFLCKHRDYGGRWRFMITCEFENYSRIAMQKFFCFFQGSYLSTTTLDRESHIPTATFLALFKAEKRIPQKKKWHLTISWLLYERKYWNVRILWEESNMALLYFGQYD